jgi:hypothetical protein
MVSSVVELGGVEVMELTLEQRSGVTVLFNTMSSSPFEPTLQQEHIDSSHMKKEQFIKRKKEKNLWV